MGFGWGEGYETTKTLCSSAFDNTYLLNKQHV